MKVTSNLTHQSLILLTKNLLISQIFVQFRGQNALKLASEGRFYSKHDESTVK